jgi:hypothetical protein
LVKISGEAKMGNGSTILERSRDAMPTKVGVSGGTQSKDWGQDVLGSVNQPTTCKRQDDTDLQAQIIFRISQMKLLEALTPASCLQEQKKESFDFPRLHTDTTTSVLQTEPPSIFENIKTNSRYKDVSELFSLFEMHDSDSNSSDADDHLSDGDTLFSILQHTHILDKQENKQDFDNELSHVHYTE